MTPLDQAERILKRFEPLDLNGSLDLCYYLGEESDDIIFKDKATTPDVLFHRLYGGYHPKGIKIRFFGGPPEKGAWHNASIYAYLTDRIARLIALHGVRAAVRVLKYGLGAIH